MLANFDYNGNLIQRRDDGYLNASQMCQANGKKLNDWARLKSTKAYLQEFSAATGNPVAELITVQNGNQTWIHKTLAINLARWLSPKFAVWCDAHIFNLMETGQTSLQVDPIEELKLKIKLAEMDKGKEEAIALQKQIEANQEQFRYTITQTCPEHVQQKVLGYSVVEKVEYRERVIQNGEVIDPGDTIGKNEICRELGILNGRGNPDTRRLNLYLDEFGEEHFVKGYRPALMRQFKRSSLPLLREVFNRSRNLHLGE